MNSVGRRIAWIMSLVAVCTATTASAKELYKSTLEPVVPVPGNTWYDAQAAFVIDGASASFEIRFGVEFVIPTTARITGPSGAFTFGLGTPLIAIHSPGPWPDGYDGATLFYGSFALTDMQRADFTAGQSTLELTGASAGDFFGTIRPAKGDTDHDGDIDDADLSSAFANYTGPGGSGLTVEDGDTDGDSDIDDADLGAAFADYTGPTAVSVPEPGALAITGLIGFVLLMRRAPKPEGCAG